MTVVGVALNFKETLARLAFEHPPQAPVLYLKTPNTWIKNGDPIPCPAGVTQLRMAGTIGLTIGRNPRQISALSIVNDISIPHDSFYRPAVRERCSDSFCVIGPPSLIEGSLPAHFEIDVLVNNVLRSSARTSSLVRSIPQLLADISDFMTLHPGDLLLIGEPDSSPLVSPGERVRVEVPGLGAIENKVVAS